MSRTKNKIETDAAAIGLTPSEYLDYIWSFNNDEIPEPPELFHQEKMIDELDFWKTPLTYDF